MVRNFLGLLALAACVLVAPACEQDSGEPTAEYVDGQSADTDDGAFQVTLFHQDGAPSVGENTFYIRVAVVDPAEPEDEGRGVPNLEVNLAASMVSDDHAMPTVPVVTYEEDGVYRVEGVMLDRPGGWSLDFDLGFNSIQEQVSFGFMVED